jgi:hypothetical protein
MKRLCPFGMAVFYVLSHPECLPQFCGMDLLGLQYYCEGNLSGLVKIEYVPADWVDQSSYKAIVTASNNWQYDIQFTQGGWMTAPVISNGRNWSENQNRTKQGKYYNKTVRAIVPNLRIEVLGELERMANHCYLLRLEDVEGRRWILGTLEQPFEFFADGTTGENGSLKHHSIRFEAQTLRKAHGFNPVL